MRTIALSTCLALVAAVGSLAGADDAKPVAKSKVTISKETTWVTEPLDAEGQVDYAAFLNKHFSRGVTPETNAVVLLYHVWGPRPEGGAGQPAEFFSLLGIDPSADDSRYFQDYQRWVADHPDLKLNPQEQELSYRRPWKAAEFPQVAAWLKDMDAQLNLAVQASQLPQYYSPLVVRKNAAGKSEGLIGVLLPGVQVSRAVARGLCARAMLKLGEGNTMEAWKDLIACHQLGRLVGRGPTLIESLVGIAIEAMAIDGELRVLGESKQAPKLVAGLKKTLQTLPPRSPMSEKINYAERCMFHDSMVLVSRGDITLNALVGNGDDSTFSKVLTGTALQMIDWNVVLKRGNEHYDKMVKSFNLPAGPQRIAEIAQRDHELKELKDKRSNPAANALGLLSGNPFLTDFAADIAMTLLFPGITSVVKAEDRIEQRGRNLDIALALAAYQSDEKSYPESLNQLVPKYLSAVPNDLFTGKPLFYERTETGYRSYSVGANLKDDGGRSAEDVPAADDLVIRMPLPPVVVKN